MRRDLLHLFPFIVIILFGFAEIMAEIVIARGIDRIQSVKMAVDEIKIARRKKVDDIARMQDGKRVLLCIRQSLKIRSIFKPGSKQLL